MPKRRRERKRVGEDIAWITSLLFPCTPDRLMMCAWEVGIKVRNKRGGGGGLIHIYMNAPLWSRGGDRKEICKEERIRPIAIQLWIRGIRLGNQMIYFLFISILLSGWAEVWQRDLRAAYGQDRLSPLAAARLVPNRLAAVVPFSSFPPHSSVGGSDVASCCLPILFLFVYFPPVSYLYFFTKKKNARWHCAPRNTTNPRHLSLYERGWP